MNPVLRATILVCGVVSLALGVLGIFLPVLPTTPFLLVAAACFIRSSERMHRWLLDHEQLGPYIRDFQSGRGIPRRGKVGAVATIWISISLSAGLLFVGMGPTRLLAFVVVILLACAAFATWYVAVRTPTRRDETMDEEPASESPERDAVRP